MKKPPRMQNLHERLHNCNYYFFTKSTWKQIHSNQIYLRTTKLNITSEQANHTITTTKLYLLPQCRPSYQPLNFRSISHTKYHLPFIHKTLSNVPKTPLARTGQRYFSTIRYVIQRETSKQFYWHPGINQQTTNKTISSFFWDINFPTSDLINNIMRVLPVYRTSH